jgi:hypothetical protein
VEFHTTHYSPARRLFSTLTLSLTLTVLGAGLVAACSSSNNNSASCVGGMQAYDGHCMATTAITYMECTKGRGFDISSQVGGGLGGTFREILGVSLNLASKKSQHEDTPVALQIIKDCLTVAEQTSQTAADRLAAQDYLQQVNQAIQKIHRLFLRPSSGAVGQVVIARATGFGPNLLVQFFLQGQLVGQKVANSEGTAEISFVVPSDFAMGSGPLTASASDSDANSAEAIFNET